MQGRRQPTRLVGVDNVLQNSSDIPSGQPRASPRIRPAPQRRLATTSDPRLLARLAPPHIPARTTKVSEKLVLLPETIEEDEREDEYARADLEEDNEAAPTRDDEESIRESRILAGGKSYAERLPKARRAEKLARVTAYCTAEAYNLRATMAFVRSKHGARTKMYEDSLYAVYHRPILPGLNGYRVRSSPMVRGPGGRSVLDEEIERGEQSDHHESGYEEAELEDVDGEGEGHDDRRQHRRSRTTHPSQPSSDWARDEKGGLSPSRWDPWAIAEMFVFAYGVVVFWNLTEHQEKDILADMTFSQTETTGGGGGGRAAMIVTRPQREEDFETEEFHFEYAPPQHGARRPRVFNDMITLRSGADHMIKLAMSHAIAQSTKLSFFEECMAHTMGYAQHIPRKLALTGELGLQREEVVRILGRLFKSRVEVNLSSNMLDVPNFFWDSEPTLYPLYTAVREYLEIKPRIQMLNERCRVFLDLAEILSDSIADQKMSRITYIIIILIIISICVTCSEVLLRFVILSSGRSRSSSSPCVSTDRWAFYGPGGGGVGGRGDDWW